jgi:hypothetical protein
MSKNNRGYFVEAPEVLEIRQGGEDVPDQWTVYIWIVIFVRSFGCHVS